MTDSLPFSHHDRPRLSRPLPGEVDLRPATLTDAPRVGELTVAAYVHDGYLSANDDYARELLDATGRLRDAELWVATIDGVVVGTVTFCPPASPYRELARTGEGEFRMLAVEPAARGRGVARALVERCLARCRELELSWLVLCTMPEMTAAHRLYVSLGFRRDPTLDWRPTPGVSLVGFRAPVPRVRT